MHALSNLQITVESDAAIAFTYVQAMHWWHATRERGPIRPADFIVGGTYTDELARTVDGWRITPRRVGYRGPVGLMHRVLPPTSIGFGGGPISY